MGNAGATPATENAGATPAFCDGALTVYSFGCAASSAHRPPCRRLPSSHRPPWRRRPWSSAARRRRQLAAATRLGGLGRAWRWPASPRPASFVSLRLAFAAASFALSADSAGGLLRGVGGGARFLAAGGECRGDGQRHHVMSKRRLHVSLLEFDGAVDYSSRRAAADDTSGYRQPRIIARAARPDHTGCPRLPAQSRLAATAANGARSRILRCDARPLRRRPTSEEESMANRSALHSLLLPAPASGFSPCRARVGAGQDGQAGADPRRLRARRHGRPHRARRRRQAEGHDRPARGRREPARRRGQDRGRRGQGRGARRRDDHGDAHRSDGGGAAHAEGDSVRSGEGLHRDRPRRDVPVRACRRTGAARRRGANSSPGPRRIRRRRRTRRRRPAACRISSVCCCRAISASTWCTSRTRAPART